MNFLGKFIAAICLLAYQISASNCFQWVVGFSSESCTTTCAKSGGRTCSLSTLQTITTNEAFNAAVGAAIQLGKDEPAVSTAAYCTGGVNSWPFATAPAVMQYPLYVKAEGEDEQGEYVLKNSCYFPTGGVQGDCDTVYSVPPAQRFCPCDKETC